MDSKETKNLFKNEENGKKVEKILETFLFKEDI